MRGRYAVPGADLIIRLDPELGVVYERGEAPPAGAP